MAKKKKKGKSKRKGQSGVAGLLSGDGLGGATTQMIGAIVGEMLTEAIEGYLNKKGRKKKLLKTLEKLISQRS